MQHSYKCKNSHKFKSTETKPLCPQCSEPGILIEWNKVSPEKPESKTDQKDKNIIGRAIETSIGTIVSTISPGTSSSSDQSSDNNFDGGKGGKFGGGGASGSY